MSDEDIKLNNLADDLIAYYNKTRNAHMKNNAPFVKALKKYTIEEIKMVIDWFSLTGKKKATPENICRLSRFDGYLSSAINLGESNKTYSMVMDKFNDICGEKIGFVDDLTVSRMSKIDDLIQEKYTVTG